MLGADVHDHYLPKPDVVGRGPRRGTGGQWPFWVLERATRLYKLRTRGVQGMMLRLMLFIHDGWGWSYVKPTVLEAFRKFIRSTQTGLRETLHKPDSPGDVNFFVEDAAEAQRKHLAARGPESEAANMKVNPGIMRFIWGVGLFGESLPGGSLRSLTPIFKGLNPTWTDAHINAGRELAEQIVTDEHMTFEKYVSEAGAIDDATAEAAIPWAKESIKARRSLAHRAAVSEGHPGQSTNPFTACGNWLEMKQSDFWQRAPERLTPTQMLAGFIGTTIVAYVVFRRSLAGQFLNFLEAMRESPSNTTDQDK